jgi:lipoic acid synthetase
MPVVPVSPERQRLPAWFKRSLQPHGTSAETARILRELNLVTVCEEATCPNRHECYSQKIATFMLLGHACTRTCTFCDVEYDRRPAPPDPTEPARVAEAVARLGLRFVVLTSVNRDDLVAGGAEQFAATIEALRARDPGVKTEVLTPDFCGDWHALAQVVAARPTVYNHNLETISRLYPTVRPQARYRRSLELLSRVKDLDPAIRTKSGIMVGLGETDDEIRWLMDDLVRSRVDIFTVGQYLRPTLEHHDIIRFVTPEMFETYKAWGKEAGFAYVASGPYVRSSYVAEEVLNGALSLDDLPVRDLPVRDTPARDLPGPGAPA